MTTQEKRRRKQLRDHARIGYGRQYTVHEGLQRLSKIERRIKNATKRSENAGAIRRAWSSIAMLIIRD